MGKLVLKFFGNFIVEKKCDLNVGWRAIGGLSGGTECMYF